MQPTQIDANKLKSILDKSKAVMRATENMKPQALSEISANLADHSVDDYEPTPTDYNEEMVANSKLPDSIKKIMLERKIPVANGFQRFSAADLYDEKDEKELPPMTFKKSTQNKPLRAPINERLENKSDLITISKSELNNLINEKLLEFMSKTYNQKLTEETITRTIKTLISEGKLTIKKKTL